VDFVLIGGIAATLYGSRHVTDDTDILVRRTAANLNRLRGALSELEARDLRKRSLEDVMADLAEAGSARTRTVAGPLDVLAAIPVDPPITYVAIARRANLTRIGRLHVRVVALDDLVEMKSRTKRVKDQARLPELRRIQELQAGRRKRAAN
jgi:hypothetical protein